MPLFNWSALLPCLLCGQARGAIHRVCPTCWQALPWKQTNITRHELECFVCCHYQFPVKQTLHQFKDHAKLEFGTFLAGCLHMMPKPKIQAIVPMPIATERLIQRGFHQTYTLAQHLAKAWHVPIWQPISRLDGHSQRGLGRDERLHNLNELFYANTPVCRYKHVLILDDVMTTGASLAALKTQLHLLGCTHIHALCLCDAAH